MIVAAIEMLAMVVGVLIIILLVMWCGAHETNIELEKIKREIIFLKEIVNLKCAHD